jgi:hypothetical protein
MLLHARFPHEPFNTAVKNGTVGEKMKRILDDLKPEAVYFTEYGGRRGVIMIVNVEDASKVPAFAEPWYLLFNADCELHIVMTPADLAQAGLETLGKKWA